MSEKHPCFCCKNDREGMWIDDRWVCGSCNHLSKKEGTDEQNA